ncbi:azaleucine resistance protein AzlC [Domibacillus sp. DTU_2020_1001157_1_SI_ALB_TIR_016]|uniref:azaleucine resistance protein AzlC n=1 Tax=Domibacillus sp. DTU_2020_1001157_1_SI_ALB_TIR_016 TaxID=3077789 RepID=UPI0028E63AD3|nr:azaleucine resistance protein AzlC [Domibacillus sp. DTU_2020_1001157_1_SI_ALB_TIR_016]WNS78748.1 azaleucine resistance protein AzlC [Domibacillus sp. DTU_2020_1001157_1_SI_ALB_TIR_016]
MKRRTQIITAFREAFPQTLPIFAGFLFLGTSYGIFMNSLGFSAIYPILMSLVIFAGSMEFLAANLLLLAFNPINAFFLTLMVNARHLFYGISMLDNYKDAGKKKWYMVFGLCDESFAVNSTINVPNNVDKGWVMFFVTLLNHFYWVLGAALGGIFGSIIQFNTEGLEFAMTALFAVIFIEQWLKEEKHSSSLIGIGMSIICLIIFGENNFIIPAMIAILGLLSLTRKALEKEEVQPI